MGRLRIIVADDNPRALKTVRSTLEPWADVVAVADNGQSALALILEHRPDVAVLDLEMPQLNGFEVTRELSRLAPEVAVVICSVYDDDQTVQAARDIGVRAFVRKRSCVRDLRTAVEGAFRGEPFPELQVC